MNAALYGGYGHQAAVARLKAKDGLRLAVVHFANQNFSKQHIPVIEPAKEAAGSLHAWWLIVAGLTGWKEQYRA